MSALWPSTLRGWFTAIALAALALSQAASLGLLAAQETILKTGLHEAEAFRRIAGLVALSENADSRTRAAIAMTASSANFVVTFSRAPAVSDDSSSRSLARALSRMSGRPAASVRAVWRSPKAAPATLNAQGQSGTLILTRSVSQQVHDSQRAAALADALTAEAQAQIARAAAAAVRAEARAHALAKAHADAAARMDANAQAQLEGHAGLTAPLEPLRPVPMAIPTPPLPPAPPVPPTPPVPPEPPTWLDRIPGAIEVLQIAPESGRTLSPLDVSMRLPDGQWLNVRATPIESASAFWPLLIAGCLTATIVAAAAFWAAGRVARPLAGLTLAATRLGQGDFTATAPESGPSDVARAGQAFNAMAGRLNRTIEDQRAVLNAVGHDLRTPIATLRLRAEQIPDADLKARILSTLAEMEGLTAATLSAARGGDSGEQPVPTDLTSLVEAVCDDLADAGFPVTAAPLDPARVLGRPSELRRAVRNLIENAVRYGETARASIQREGAHVIVSVEDNGPGIPEYQLSEVLKPFVRLESSRNRDTGGHGLGLTIARAIAERHGGTLSLANRPEGGLSARLTLPLAA